MRLIKLSVVAVLAVFALTSCGRKEVSEGTGWVYNNQEWGGFEKITDYEGQEIGPNLVPIEGGTFLMGNAGEDVPYDWNNISRRVTVSSFMMDETEVPNILYREYLYWTKRVFGETYPEIYLEALPDTLVWREELAYNEPMVETYFRHPSFDDYPVVGVSWEQASDFCKWRTDRVNEMLLIRKGYLNPNPEQQDEANFNTEAYLAGVQEESAISVRKGRKDFRTGGERQIRFEDGILLPAYRLPTEAEWEYAALALRGKLVSEQDERISDTRIYPWDGSTMRYQRRDKYQGKMLANYKRSSGDYMGMSGNLNDKAAYTSAVRSYYPNDFGLYHMAGNVSEWVEDVYRPLTSSTLRDVENHDLNAVRGGVFKTKILDEEGKPQTDSMGRLQYREVENDEVASRENYKVGSVYDYLDGDERSSVDYEYGVHTLVSNNARVYKGGSWEDRAYWLRPGTRRYKDQDRASRSIGFRCAMTKTGAPGNDGASGNQFKVKQKKRKY